MPDPKRTALVHVPVVQLEVPERWRVGNVEFWPPGGLEELVGTRDPLHGGADPGFTDWHRETYQWASTAAVRLPWPDDFALQAEVTKRAIDQVRDALAVLRLYKRARYPLVPQDIQEFGLHGEVGGTMQWTATTRGRVQIYSSSRWVGIIGDWKFTPSDVLEYRSDPRFAFLDAALRRPIRRTELQRRAITALRVRAMSTAMQRPQLRVILLATALEALLAEEVEPGERRPRSEFFRITQRAAYLTCGLPDAGYPSRRPCFYLEATSEAAMRRSFEDRAKRGDRPLCSAFLNVFRLLEDRNQALHLAREDFEPRELVMHRWTADDVILRALEWATRAGARSLRQLDAELEAFVRGGTALT